ncbi:organelle RRM domain-containing protein 2, mitochondrial-like isoform X1 [Zingiber officinale]|uniref:organelle RRM domain-containing protein 2, mitochondrial-like isoform X1 n=1 Tax=Zingiber officinale TaxID=94328 RepID=UPI001C4C2DA4|nr:organelle RRM domain-containing protein 2, mitochondrial-like isoform X1 [Zingiber officinale]
MSLLTPSSSSLLQSRISGNPSPAPQPTRFLRPRPLRSLSTSLQPHGNGRNKPALPTCGCSASDLAISQEAPSPSSRIFIKGLSRSTSEGFLAKTFSSFGKISKVKIITSKTSKQSLGLAYIWFAREQEALMAVNEMDGKFLDGRFIAVKIADVESPSKQVRPRPYRF